MSRSVDWTFDGTWPFEPKWHETPEGVMHFVDEGPRDGRPVVLVHGNPTWGYLYREFIAALVAGGNRAIVPDHLGFGRSEKPGEPKLYGVRRHAQRLEGLLESLDLRGAALVAHDWGGPTGLSWATRHSDRVEGLFLINTLAHSFRREVLPAGKERVPLPLPLHVLRAPAVGELLVQGLDAFKPLMFRLAIERKERLTPSVRRAYREVHGGWSERAAMLEFARQVPTRAEGPVDELNRETEGALRECFRSKPVSIVWGTRDRVLSPAYVDSLWLNTFPDAQVTLIDGAGHFVQEDAPERVVPLLTRFVAAL